MNDQALAAQPSAATMFATLARQTSSGTGGVYGRGVGVPRRNDARAIAEGDLVRAADIIDGLGQSAAAAYARLRAAEALAAAGDDAEAAEQRAAAEAFYRQAGATAFLQRSELAESSGLAGG